MQQCEAVLLRASLSKDPAWLLTHSWLKLEYAFDTDGQGESVSHRDYHSRRGHAGQGGIQDGQAVVGQGFGDGDTGGCIEAEGITADLE